jgi:hypothetical protein
MVFAPGWLVCSVPLIYLTAQINELGETLGFGWERGEIGGKQAKSGEKCGIRDVALDREAAQGSTITASPSESKNVVFKTIPNN